MGKIRPDARPYGMQAIDLLAQIIDDHDGPVTFPASKIPHEAAGRLLETLGVTIVDDVKAVRPRPRPPRHPGPKKRWRDEHPVSTDEIVQRKVVEALAKRGGDPDDPLEAAARRWAA